MIVTGVQAKNLELFLDTSSESLLVELTAHYTRMVSRGKVNPIQLSSVSKSLISSGVLNVPALPSLITSSGVLTDVFSITNYLINNSYTEDILLGEGNDVELVSILDICKSAKSNDALLNFFNKKLEDRVFLIGNNITLADLILFAYFYPIVTVLDDASKWNNNNVFRWYNNVQRLEGIAEFLKDTSRVISSYPLPLADAKAEAGKGKPAANKKK